jgi:hypothetical protein
MFKQKQRKFEEQLLRKKSQMAITRPQSPNFAKTKSRPLQRDYVNEQAPSYKTLRHSRSEAKNLLHSSKPVKQPSSTRAMELS